MTSIDETAAIGRAFLALVMAVTHLEAALIELTPSQNQSFLDHMRAAGNARNECTEYLKKLIELMERHHE
jgi:hypothetical protein